MIGLVESAAVVKSSTHGLFRGARAHGDIICEDPSCWFRFLTIALLLLNATLLFIASNLLDRYQFDSLIAHQNYLAVMSSE